MEILNGIECLDEDYSYIQKLVRWRILLIKNTNDPTDHWLDLNDEESDDEKEPVKPQVVKKNVSAYKR